MRGKRFAYMLVSASFVVGTPAVLAWSDASGIIRSVDRETRELVLANGKTFPVVRGINLAKFNEGDHVVIHTESDKGREIVTKMTKGDGLTMPVPKIHSRTL